MLVAAGIGVSAAPHLTKEDRANLIARAQVWTATDIASKNLLTGPDGPGAFPPDAVVNCDYVDKKLNGHTPKFDCLIAPGDEVKVKFGGTNGEVYAEVAATRLLWALGFYADRMYSVRVICRGCPASMGGIPRTDGTRVIDPAAIERKLDGKAIKSPSEGWSWNELVRVREDAGGAPLAQRDALILLAAFIQHTDSKPVQQRLLCAKTRGAKAKASGSPADEGCAVPVMMIDDLGMTFGRANFTNSGDRGSMNLDAWSKLPVWKDPARCIAGLSHSYSGTLTDPQVSEEGRRFLADLLSQLTDEQLRDMFTAARVDLRTRVPNDPRSGLATVAEWVDAFKVKRAQIVENTCRQPVSTSARQTS
jgi:hypothetical protein